MNRADWFKFLASVGLGCCIAGARGQAVAPAASQAASVSPPAAAVAVPSVQVQPALRPLKLSLNALNVDRWKTSKATKEATAANLNSIRKDLEETLPGLLSSADAAPASVAAVLPVARNLDALYDVALRVTVVAETAAPQDQIESLQAALSSLDTAKRSLNERLQSGAESQARQIVELTKQLNAASAAAPAPAPVCPLLPPLPPAKKKKKPAAAPPAAY